MQRIGDGVQEFLTGMGDFAPTTTDNQTLWSATKDTARAGYNLVLFGAQVGEAINPLAPIQREISSALGFDLPFASDLRATYDTPSFGLTVDFLGSFGVPKLASFFGSTSRALKSSAAVDQLAVEAAPASVQSQIAFRENFVGPHPQGTGPVFFNPPPNATSAEIAQVKAYIDGANEALLADVLSPTGRVATAGKISQQGSREAALERARAADAGSPYIGQAGHVPDKTWSGTNPPFSWLDLSPRVNASLGSQAKNYPIGYKPYVFVINKAK